MSTLAQRHIPFAAPSIGPAEVAAAVEALESGWLTTGPRVGRFEEEFSAAVAAPAALAVSSGTAALHLALLALGVRPGDAVITSTMTFCSTVHVIEHVGARPLLVDVEPDTLNMSVTEVESALSSAAGRRVTAIMPVHFGGQPCQMPALLDLAQQYELAVVEDAAHAFGANLDCIPIGNVGAFGRRAVAFSFYATKNITTGEGGMLTGPGNVVEEAREWSLHGMSRDAWRRYGPGGSWQYDVTRPGFKYNMTDVQAAIGRIQLARSDDLRARREEIAMRYHAAFRDLRGLSIPVSRSNVRHAWHLYVVKIDPDGPVSRDQFIAGLTARGVGTSVHFIPVHMHQYYRQRYGYAAADYPVAASEFHKIVSLPIYAAMTDEDVDAVIDAVRAVLAPEERRSL